MSNSNTAAQSISPTVVDKEITSRLEEQRRRIYNAVGTIETVMKVLTGIFDGEDRDDELTPLWSALLLATETLEDVAGKLEAPVILKPSSEALAAAA